VSIMILPMKCPHCGAGLRASTSTKYCTCMHCRSQFELVDEGGDVLLREIASTVRAMNETVVQTERTLRDVRQQVGDLHRKAFPPEDYVASFTPKTPDSIWPEVYQFVMVTIGLVVIGMSSGAGWAFFWAPILYLGLFARGIGDVPLSLWTPRQKTIYIVLTLAFAGALINLFG
jgi:hypothetical protein